MIYIQFIISLYTYNLLFTDTHTIYNLTIQIIYCLMIENQFII